ncbi:MAG TPA: GNAT family N-acetyltransferase [Candidatus Eisenbacteria bacterium]|nr:GNAT family N-acetyltransferase [Candidatus Eisenbacteria bacterium]
MRATSALTAARATEDDVAAIATLRTAAALRLTALHGKGHWSSPSSHKQVLRSIRNSTVVKAQNGSGVLGSLALVTKKPWAIDAAYFTAARRPLYLLEMAVHPEAQGMGVGRFLLDEAERVARDWPADAIRLDAYDAPAGAGNFYAKCGYVERGRVVYRTVPLIYYERVLG